MLRRSDGTVALAVLLSITAGAAQADEPMPDVLTIDSFESGDDSPEGWEQGPAVSGVKYVYDRNIGSDGKRSLSLQKSERSFFPIAQWGRMFEHGSKKPVLRVAAKVKASSVAKAIVEVQFYGPDAKFLSKEWIAYIGQKNAKDRVATHDWKVYGDAVKIPQGTEQIAIALQIYGPGKVWFDELEARYFDTLEAGKKGAPVATVPPKSPTPEQVEARKEYRPEELQLSSGAQVRYLFIKAREARRGHPLLIVLPGGDGSEEFHPFVRAIHEHALDGRFVVAQLLAPPHVVWPTRSSLAHSATTEEAIAAVIEEAVRTQGIDRAQVFALAWSSGGPPVYAALLQEKSPLAGAFIAMSVFKPDQLPPLANAAGRRLYLFHSPEDKVCPYPMAKTAEEKLTAAGAKVTLVDYPGGHGWHGPVHDNIRAGIEWLQKTSGR